MTGGNVSLSTLITPGGYITKDESYLHPIYGYLFYTYRLRDVLFLTKNYNDSILWNMSYHISQIYSLTEIRIKNICKDYEN